MSRFESSRPSHAVDNSGDFAQSGRKAHVPWAFAEPEIRDRPAEASGAAFRAPVSNADFPISGNALGRAAETGSIQSETGSKSPGPVPVSERGVYALQTNVAGNIQRTAAQSH